MSGDATTLAPVTWLTVPEAADRLQVGPRMIYNAIASGQLRASRIGARGQFRMLPSWVDDYAISLAPVPMLGAHRKAG